MPGTIEKSEPGEPPLLWRDGAFYDKRFLKWDGAHIYQIPEGETLQSQANNNTKIHIEPGTSEPALTLPTRAMEVAIYQGDDKFLIPNRATTLITPAELLEDTLKNLKKLKALLKVKLLFHTSLRLFGFYKDTLQKGRKKKRKVA